MLTTFELGISLVAMAVGMVLGRVIVYYTQTRIPARHGAESSPPKPETPSVKKPSIERSETNSTASITVQANPDRPLVYDVEPLNGSRRLRKLTVLYEESLGDLESATLRSVDSVSIGDNEPPWLGHVDDPVWAERVKKARDAL